MQPSAGGPFTPYDFIYQDALNDGSLPFQLVTTEFNEKISSLLADDGVYLVGLTDSYESGRLLGAVVGTLQETFGHVSVVTSGAGGPSPQDSFVVVAAKRAIDVAALLKGYSRHLKFRLLDNADVERVREKSGGYLLTDDYAPVENLLAPAVRQRAAKLLAHKTLDKARALREQGRSGIREARSLLAARQSEESAAERRRAFERYDRSIEQYERARQLDPAMTVMACNEVGKMRMEQDKPEQAVRAFQDAIEHHRATGAADPAIASVHVNLATLLRRTGRGPEANAHLTEAVKSLRIDLEENPRLAFAWDRLGNVLVTLEDMKGASDAFARALELEPANPSYYGRLAKALEQQKRYGEAIEVVRKELRLLQERGAQGMAKQARDRLELLEYQRAKQPR